MPGKLFEYLATGLPVLGVGPVNGDAADFLTSTRAGVMFDGNDQSGIRIFLQKEFGQWYEEVLRKKTQGEDQYSRKGTTQTLVEVINRHTR